MPFRIPTSRAFLVLLITPQISGLRPQASGLAALAPLCSFVLLIYSVMDESVSSNGPRPDPGGKYDSIQGRQLYNIGDFNLDLGGAMEIRWLCDRRLF
jgi:hypothetical protein